MKLGDEGVRVMIKKSGTLFLAKLSAIEVVAVVGWDKTEEFTFRK